jgi:hypothetical protein
MTDKQVSTDNFFRTIALTIVVIGAIGSLYFMFNAGRHQKSIFLIVCFTAWVLSPFVALLMVRKMPDRWTTSARASFYWFMIVLTIGSLVAYSGALNTPQTKPAFVFLVVPFISWLLIAAVTFIATRPPHDTK